MYNNIVGVLLLLCLLLPGCKGVCQTTLPFHAQIINDTSSLCTWKCVQGYFKSKQQCRPCSPRFACHTGWRFNPCSDAADALCTMCDPPKEGERYTSDDNINSNCSSVGCIPGYTTTAAGCRPCEKGFYCSSGDNIQTCGANCTTLGVGVSNSLECMSTIHQAAEAVFSISSLVSFSRGKAPNQTTSCPILDSMLSSWIQYGTFSGCSLQFSNDIMGIIQCKAGIAPCVAGQYMQWLALVIHAHENDIRTLVKDCLKLPLLVMGTPLIQNSQVGNAQYAGWKTLQHRPSSPPRLAYESQTWGRKKTEALTTLMWAATVCLFLLLIFICGCSLGCRRIQHRHGVDALYKALNYNHHHHHHHHHAQSLV